MANYPAIYREELARLEYGVPNYYPDEPGPPTEEIQIGDVGFFLPSGIHNICVHESPDFLNAGPICSGTVRRVTGGAGAQGLSVAGAGIRLHCSKDQGAFLILQTSGFQKKVVENEWIGEYMINHREEWHNFAKRHRLGVSKNDFVLISGFVKTTNWALGAFSKRSVEMTIDVSGELGPTAQAGINVEIGNRSYSSVQPRVGPSSRMMRRSSSSVCA
ncbi:hypothetical protein K474DRAFT_172069 [Panus rudis PR-1116 ss-1]|nr:hypothetical protein K474DRAFT_172069 [Panus rudis PR-1116 ss-1]